MTVTHETMVLAADQTGWPAGATVSSVLGEYAAYQARVGRVYFVRRHVQGEGLNDVKVDLCRKFGLTARHLTSISVVYDGKAAAVLELMKVNLQTLQGRITATKAKIKLLGKKRNASVKLDVQHREWLKKRKDAVLVGKKQPKLSKSLFGFKSGKEADYRASLMEQKHQKQRYLASLVLKLETLEKDIEAGRISLCFGSKSLFRKQFNLAENSYKNHAEWKTDWQAARTNQIFCIGSKDQNFGSQTASWICEGQLRLRLPFHMEGRFGKYVVLCLKRFRREGVQDQVERIAAAGGRRDDQNALVPEAQALSWRLVRRQTKHGETWVAQVMFDQAPAKLVSDDRFGAWGLDLNPDHIAMTLVDRFGNPVERETYPLDLVGKSKHQATAIIGDAAAWAIGLCEKHGVPLCAEKLDFQEKKAALREKGPGYARMLSQFAYAKVESMVDARAAACGIEVRRRNPAFTSVIGQAKFSLGYNLSVHHAAGCAIARRGLRFSERLSRRVHSPKEAGKSPTSRNALPLPARTRGKHVWRDWGRLSKSLRALRLKRTAVGATGARQISAVPILVGTASGGPDVSPRERQSVYRCKPGASQRRRSLAGRGTTTVDVNDNAS